MNTIAAAPAAATITAAAELTHLLLSVDGPISHVRCRYSYGCGKGMTCYGEAQGSETTYSTTYTTEYAQGSYDCPTSAPTSVEERHRRQPRQSHHAAGSVTRTLPNPPHHPNVHQPIQHHY